MNNGSFSTGGQPQNPSFGTVVVTAALQLNAGAVFDLFNTTDKTTNYERLRASFVANVAYLQTENGGTGTLRSFRIGSGNSNPTILFDPNAGRITHTSTGAGSLFVPISVASSGTPAGVAVTPSIQQSSTAGYTALLVNPTESATGSGRKLLTSWQVGGSDRAWVDSNGTFRSNNTFIAVGGFAFEPTFNAGADLNIIRDAADTLAQRRSTNAQAFRGYETYTDGSNYSRWYQAFSGGFAYYGTQAAGTGTRRPLIVQHFTTTLAALPTAATAGAGSRAVVSDATAPVFGVAVVGGGAVVSPVYSDGANWIVG